MSQRDLSSSPDGNKSRERKKGSPHVDQEDACAADGQHAPSAREHALLHKTDGGQDIKGLKLLLGDDVQLAYLEAVQQQMTQQCDYLSGAGAALQALERILAGSNRGRELKPGPRVYCLAQGVPGEESPKLEALRRRLEELSKRLCAEEMENQESAWADVKKDIRKCFKMCTEGDAYRYPSKDYRPSHWEAWVTKVIFDIVCGNTTLHELQSEIASRPSVYPLRWNTLPFEKPLAQVAASLWNLLQASKGIPQCTESGRPKLGARRPTWKKELASRCTENEHTQEMCCLVRAQKTRQANAIGLLQEREKSHLSAREIQEILREVSTVQRTGSILPVALETTPGMVAHEARYVPKERLAVACKRVRELVQQGFVVKSTESEWLNPIHLVKKSSDEWILCLDLRELNLLVAQDTYPLPNVTTVTDDLLGTQYFTKISIKDGFLRVPLAEKAQAKTTFKLGKTFYRFTGLPMGYRNAPNIFQRVMESILHEEADICIVYIEDILIFSMDLESHREHIKAVLEKLKKYGMEVNWEKALIARAQIEFLGYYIGHDEICPLPSRVQAVLDSPEPTDMKTLRRLIGLLGCDRRFLRNISETLKPLHVLMKQDGAWHWTDIHQTAFEEAKKKLARAPKLIIPNYRKRFTLEVESSDVGIGAMLRQNEGIVGFYSGNLTEAERKYAPDERQLYAIAWAFEKCKYYLLGVEFDLVASQQAVALCQKKPGLEDTQLREWRRVLSEYNYVLKNR
ncbi:uncharacterized protein NEMAJ01_2012 [Nematocida major]|uniref:uncharacterized protein n=1 Tax=Nematocida major TaxID=1912982 RepID=UPI002008ADCE|nr:uncharacterized protein NEMAJ01_2012 [Nematocida major]KAH9387116.1 hypothetical protein NEMAJ01_2012 [Nematocida major]